MSSIQTGIELRDNFTGVIYDIINSVNLAVSAIDEMQQVLCSDVSNASLVGARDEINQATMAVYELDAALNSMSAPDIPAIPAAIEPQWQSDNLDVFSSSGMDRYQQEVQSTNAMLEQLSSTQNAIAKQAYNTMIFPPEAFQNLNSMAVRIDTIRDRIQQMESNPVNMGTDTANAELEHMRAQLVQAVQQQNNLNAAMDNLDVEGANEAYLSLSHTISSTERYIRDNIDAQGQFVDVVRNTGPPVGQVTAGLKGWQAAIITANQAVSLISNTLGQLGVFDISGAFSRIDTMNQFQRTITTMTGDANMANAALAQLKDTTIGTAYGLDVASKSAQGFVTRGMALGTATNQVRIWADAVSFYGNGTNEQLESVVDAIGKMMSKGKVEADQLDRLFDAGIPAAEIYAQAVGESVSAVKDDLSDGAISSAQFINVISHAMDSGISNGAAKEMGDNWANTFRNTGAAITRGWVEIITQLDTALEARGLPSTMEMVTMFGTKVEQILTTVAGYMGYVVDMAIGIGEAMSNAGTWIADNWSVISPIICGVATVLGLYTLAMIAYNVVQGISNVLKSIAAVNAVAHGAAITGEMLATTGMTAAQLSFNATLLACPITWIIIGIIALIAILFAVCNAIAKTTKIADSGFGIICGSVNVAIQFFKNLGLMAANIALGIGFAISALTYNMIMAFKNAISNIQSWWYNLLSTALTVVAGICEALNKLPFVEFDYSGITSKADEYAAKSAEAAGNKREYLSVGDAFDKGLGTFEAFGDGWINDAFNAGANWGDGVAKKVSEFDLSDMFDANELEKDKITNNGDNYPALTDTGIPGAVNDISDNTSAIKDSVEIANEDLKYLRDAAERDTINRFTTAEIKVEMTNNNTINSDMDLDGIPEYLRSTIEQEMNAAAEGVY